MAIPDFIRRKLVERASIVMDREPDFVIGDNYLRRWFCIPRNRWFNVYLHMIKRSDDDRALHDHPWLNCSIVLAGGYFEHTIAYGGVESRTWRGRGSVTFRRAKAAHRLEVDKSREPFALSLFITGPRIRQWGFHCPKGWRHWQEFTAPGDSSKVGMGCE